MSQPALLPTLLALGLAAFASMALAPGCGDNKQQTSSSAGSAGTAGSTSSSGGTGGSAGSAGSTSSGMTTTSSTTNAECTTLCDHLKQIKCDVLKNCDADCNNHLNAPADCADEADALIECWAMNINDFMCTMKQVLPPAACKDKESAFNACVNGGAPDASCICSAGVGVGDGVTNCSRKTTCAMTEYSQVCQKIADGQPWTCSCFSNGGLLGTCSEDPAVVHCSNDYGCCVPLFCAANP